MNMKTTNFITLLFLMALMACGSNDKSIAQKVNFGIYETVNVEKIPGLIIENMKSSNIQFEKDTKLPIIGYVLKTDTSNLLFDYAKENIRLAKTYYTVDKEAKYQAIVALKSNPNINIQDISNTKVSGKNVEIHFNMAGAKKWAEMTKNNLGNIAAFTIDNQIYTMPIINGEIKNGLALISGLNDEALAKKISDLLNAGTN
jgi:preprotein translocase subunit SecD